MWCQSRRSGSWQSLYHNPYLLYLFQFSLNYLNFLEVIQFSPILFFIIIFHISSLFFLQKIYIKKRKNIFPCRPIFSFFYTGKWKKEKEITKWKSNSWLLTTWTIEQGEREVQEWLTNPPPIRVAPSSRQPNLPKPPGGASTMEEDNPNRKYFKDIFLDKHPGLNHYYS